MSSDGSFAFLLPFILVTFGVLFLAVSRWGSRPALRWGIGYLLSAAGFVTPWVFLDVSVELHALVADALFLAAAYFYADALFLHFGKVRLVRFRIGFLLAIYGAITFAVLIAGSLHAELLFGDIGFTGLQVLALGCVWRQARSRIEQALLFVVGLSIADGIIRNVMLVLILPSSDGLASFATSDYAYAMQVTGSVLGMLMALTALATVVLKAISEYRDAADRDPLTRLLNRRGFERFAPTLKRGEQLNGTVIACDIDHFKTVNDRHGHAKGDLVLIAFADLLRQFVPAKASVSRFGGEEFVVCLPDASAQDAGQIANAIRLAFEHRDWSDIGINPKITASFGIGCPEAGDHSIHDAIARADRALYAAKSAGRNRVATDTKPPALRSLQIMPAA